MRLAFIGNCIASIFFLSATFCPLLISIKEGRKFSAMTSRVSTQVMSALFARFIVFAIVTAILSPVKLPGPMARQIFLIFSRF